MDVYFGRSKENIRCTYYKEHLNSQVHTLALNLTPRQSRKQNKLIAPVVQCVTQGSNANMVDKCLLEFHKRCQRGRSKGPPFGRIVLDYSLTSLQILSRVFHGREVVDYINKFHDQLHTDFEPKHNLIHLTMCGPKLWKNLRSEVKNCFNIRLTRTFLLVTYGTYVLMKNRNLLYIQQNKEM
jgi:hypothetical protein